MSVELIRVPGPMPVQFDFGNVSQVLLVIQAVSEHVSKILERTLERIRCRFFLGLFKRCGFSF